MVLALVYFVFKYLAPLFLPFLMGFIFALLLRPVIRLLQSKAKFSPKLAAIVSVIALFGVAGVLLTLLGGELFGYLKSVILKLPDFYSETIAPSLIAAYDKLNAALTSAAPQLGEALRSGIDGFIASLGDTISSVSVSVLGAASGYASSLPKAVVGLLIMIISTFFIAVDFDEITGFISRQMSSEKRAAAREVKSAALETTGKLLRSYLLIMSITFCELTLGYWILGVNYFPLIAAVTAVIDIFPVVGTGTIVIPWALVDLLTGNYARGAGLLVLYVVVLIVRQIIEPKIVGKNVGLHPIVTLMAMYIGTMLFGVLGLFGLPLVISVAKALNDKGVIKLFK